MDAPPSLIFVFDVSAITAGKTREWQWFSGLGECWLPQTVLDEMEFLCNRAAEPSIESTAREFARFLPGSDWQVTEISDSHPALKPASGQNVSKRARIALSVAQTAYGLSRSFPGTLIVLIANEQSLLRRLQNLGVPTLTGLPVSALLQWHRTGQPPAAFATQLKAMELGTPLPTAASPAAHPASSAASKTTKSPPRKTTSRAQSGARPQSSASRSARSSLLSQLISGLMALIFLTVGVGLLWKLGQPESFDRTWQKLGLPALPGSK